MKKSKCPLGEAHPEQPDMELTADIIRILEAWQEEGKDYITQFSFKGIAHEVLRMQADRHPSREAITGDMLHRILTHWVRKASPEEFQAYYLQRLNNAARYILSLIQPELTVKKVLSKEMTAWILKRLNSKDGAEFMMALSTSKSLPHEQEAHPEQEIGKMVSIMSPDPIWEAITFKDCAEKLYEAGYRLIPEQLAHDKEGGVGE